jgi:hypothetical protein
MRTAIMHGDMNGDKTKHRSYFACDENAVPELQDMHENGPLLGSKVSLKRFKETNVRQPISSRSDFEVAEALGQTE